MEKDIQPVVRCRPYDFRYLDGEHTLSTIMGLGSLKLWYLFSDQRSLDIQG